MRSRPGHTLLEALVALLVAAAAVVVGYGVFAATLDARVHTSARAQATLRAAALRAQLIDWIANAHTPTDTSGYRFLIRDPNSDGFGDELSFVTTRLPPFHEQTREVTIRWGVDEANQTLIASTRALGAHTFDQPVLLSRWIRGFTVRVLPADGNEWLGHWTSAVVLPAAVELRITSANADSLSSAVNAPIIIRLYPTQ